MKLVRYRLIKSIVGCMSRHSHTRTRLTSCIPSFVIFVIWHHWNQYDGVYGAYVIPGTTRTPIVAFTGSMRNCRLYLFIRTVQYTEFSRLERVPVCCGSKMYFEYSSTTVVQFFERVRRTPVR